MKNTIAATLMALGATGCLSATEMTFVDGNAPTGQPEAFAEVLDVQVLDAGLYGHCVEAAEQWAPARQVQCYDVGETAPEGSWSLFFADPGAGFWGMTNHGLLTMRIRNGEYLQYWADGSLRKGPEKSYDCMQTTVAHEMGHALGLPDRPAGSGEGIMDQSSACGTRVSAYDLGLLR